MKLLDLFCGAGGAAMGYYRAGFTDITGVDIKPMPRYPFKFIQADAMTFPLEGYDLIHASPPCQAYSATKRMKQCRDRVYPDLVSGIRKRLEATEKTYVIENVKGSPLVNPVKLTGIMFGLKLFRERWFEINIFMLAPQLPGSNGEMIGKNGFVCMAGHGDSGRNRIPADHRTVRAWKAASGIDWMTQKELAQAIPPAYTEWIGRRILECKNL